MCQCECRQPPVDWEPPSVALIPNRLRFADQHPERRAAAVRQEDDDPRFADDAFAEYQAGLAEGQEGGS